MPIILALMRENAAGVAALRSCSSALFVWFLWFFSFAWLSGRSGFFGSLIELHEIDLRDQIDTLVYPAYFVRRTTQTLSS